MAQGRYTATLRGEIAKVKGLWRAVHLESVQRTIELMQTPVAKGGNMPVKSGFLRASLKATIGTANFATMPSPGGDKTFSYDGGAVSLIIARAKLSDPIEAVYTAVYARVANYGGQNRSARLFVDLAAQRWVQTVNEVAAEAKARAGL